MKRIALFLVSVIAAIAGYANVRGIVVNQDGDLISGVIVNGEEHCSKGNPNRFTTSYDGYFEVRFAGKSGKMTLKLSGDYIEDSEFKIAAADTAVFQVLCVKVKQPQRPEYNGRPKYSGGKGTKVLLRSPAVEAEETGAVMYEMADVRSTDASAADAKLTVKPKPGGAVANNVHAGMLTAGEVNDFAKWHLWENIRTQSHAEHAKTWGLYPKTRYTLHLTNASHSPLYDAEVLLLDADKNVIWRARTDNTGKAELWADMMVEPGKKETAKAAPQLVLVRYKGIEQGIPAGKDLHVSLNVPCPESRNVDVMFVVDATGSMGDEIRYMQAEIENVAERVHQNDKDVVMRTGAIFYRDHGDDYLCRISTLSNKLDSTKRFMEKQHASGGGDYEEAVGEALMAAVNSSNWSRDAVARIVFLILDAPPHDDSTNVALIQKQLRDAAAKGIRLVPVVCSGMRESGEYLFRSMALATNGTSLFLTDDSGIGDTHLKPTTDKLEVEMLNDMMVRIIGEFSAVPDCEADKWAEDNKDESNTDQFVPNPFDIKDLDGYDMPDTPEVFTASDVIQLRPNPCTGMFQVVVLQDVENMFLVDMTGKALQTLGKQTQGTTLEVNVGGYSTGIYFVKAFRKGKWYTQKEIVK